MKIIGTMGGKPIFHDPTLPWTPGNPGIAFGVVNLTGFTRRTLIVSGRVVRDEPILPARPAPKESP